MLVKSPSKPSPSKDLPVDVAPERPLCGRCPDCAAGPRGIHGNGETHAVELLQAARPHRRAVTERIRAIQARLVIDIALCAGGDSPAERHAGLRPAAERAGASGSEQAGASLRESRGRRCRRTHAFGLEARSHRRGNARERTPGDGGHGVLKGIGFGCIRGYGGVEALARLAGRVRRRHGYRCLAFRQRRHRHMAAGDTHANRITGCRCRKGQPGARKSPRRIHQGRIATRNQVHIRQ